MIMKIPIPFYVLVSRFAFIVVLFPATFVTSLAAESYPSVEKYLEAATDNRLSDFNHKLSTTRSRQVPDIFGVLTSKDNSCSTIFVLERIAKGLTLTEQSPTFLCLDSGYVESIKGLSSKRFEIQLHAPKYDFSYRFRFKKNGH